MRNGTGHGTLSPWVRLFVATVVLAARLTDLKAQRSGDLVDGRTPERTCLPALAGEHAELYRG